MRILFATVLAVVCSAAAAQMRTIPQEAPVGTIRYLEGMQVELDGEPRPLAPGVQVRDADNRLVLPASLLEREREPVRYLLDGAGSVYRVWMLSAPEKEALPQPPSPFPQ